MPRSTRSSRRSPYRSKAMLLPLPSAIVRSRSLKFHAALAMVRRDLADAEHLVELARVTYLAWFLQRAGYGALPLAQLHEAEQYMEQANRQGAEIDRWYLDEAAYPGFERILAQHEQQLASAPAYAVVAAEDELSRFIAGDTHSPLPPITLEQSSATADAHDPTMPEQTDVLLFSYGTLQLERVQLESFGRLLHGEDDAMPGYSQSMVEITDPEVVRKSGEKFHPIVTPTGNPADEVHGKVFSVTETELAAADSYEVSDYQRVRVQLRSGKHAWVYVRA